MHLALWWLTYLRENRQTWALTLSTIWPRNWKHATNHTVRWKGELWHMSPTKVTRSIPCSWRMHSYRRGRIVPTRSWASGEHTTGTRSSRRTVTEDDAGNEPLPKGGASLFCVWGYRSLCMRNCPHCEAFRTWHKQHLNSLGAGQKNRMPAPKNNQLK